MGVLPEGILDAAILFDLIILAVFVSLARAYAKNVLDRQGISANPISPKESEQ
jgi:hypothetical protein